VAQGEVLQGDMAVSAAEEGKQSKQAEQEGHVSQVKILVTLLPFGVLTWDSDRIRTRI